MNTVSTPHEQNTVPRNARLRALAAMFACVFALTAAAFCPSNVEQAYAKEPFPNIGTVVVVAPEGYAGPLPPVYLSKLPGEGNLVKFPSDTGGGHASRDITVNPDGCLESAEIDSPTFKLTLTASGTGKADNEPAVVKVTIENMLDYENADITVKVYFRPVLQNFTLNALEDLQYIPLKPGETNRTKYYGYEGYETDEFVDNIKAEYAEKNSAPEVWGRYPLGWTYLYRNNQGNPVKYHPELDYQTLIDTDKRPEFAPVNAGSYQLTIAGLYVQQVDQENNVHKAAGWTTIDFTVAKASAFEHTYYAENTLDVRNGDSHIKLREKLDVDSGTTLVPVDCMADPSDHSTSDRPTYTITSTDYVGLSNVTVTPEGELTLFTNGLGNGHVGDMVTVSVTDMDNYEDSTITIPVTYEAKPKAQYADKPTAETGLVFDNTQKKGYTGSAKVTWKEGATPYELLLENPLYEGTTFGGTKYGPTTTQPTDAGNYTVTFSVPADERCQADPLVLDFTIAKAAAPTIEYPDAELLNFNSFRTPVIPLKGAPDDAGIPVYRVTDYSSKGLANATIDSSTGELTLEANGKANDQTSDTVTVSLSMGNYQDCAATLHVTYAPLPVADAITGAQAAKGLVYNGASQAGYTGEPSTTYLPYRENERTAHTGPFDISYTGTAIDGTAYGPIRQAPTAAGTYTVTFSVPATVPCIAEPLTMEFAIAQAPLTFSAADASMTANGPLPTLGYTVAGLMGADHVVQAPTLTVEGDTTKTGYCTIAITGGTVDNQANYRVDYKPGTLTVHTPKKDDPKPLSLKDNDGKRMAPTGDNVPFGPIAAIAGASALIAGFVIARRSAGRRN